MQANGKRRECGPCKRENAQRVKDEKRRAIAKTLPKVKLKFREYNVLLNNEWVDVATLWPDKIDGSLPRFMSRLAALRKKYNQTLRIVMDDYHGAKIRIFRKLTTAEKRDLQIYRDQR